MDPFAVVILSGLVIIVVSVWLVGRYYPGSGLEQVGLRSAREIHETREALEAEDLDQMLAAHNARRRARGQAEMSVSDLELRVSADLRDQERRREAYLADRELDQLLEATNRRRRARGLPDRTLEQVRQEFGGAPPPADAPPPANLSGEPGGPPPGGESTPGGGSATGGAPSADG